MRCWLRTLYFVGEWRGPHLIGTISHYTCSGAGSVSNSFSRLERNYDVFDGNDNGNDVSDDDSLIITIGSFRSPPVLAFPHFGRSSIQNVFDISISIFGSLQEIRFGEEWHGDPLWVFRYGGKNRDGRIHGEKDLSFFHLCRYA